MSDFTPSVFALSSALAQRIASFAGEIIDAAELAEFLALNTPDRVESTLYDEVRKELDGLNLPLLEALGASGSDACAEGKDVLALSHPAPYLLPLALTQVSRMQRRAPLFAQLAFQHHMEEEHYRKLAVEFFAMRLDYVGEIAADLREQVVRELPPLDGFITMTVASMVA